MSTPSRRVRIPKLARHKGKNLAFVVLNGKFVYLGKWGDCDDPCREARRQYDRAVAEWLAAGRRHVEADHILTVAELVERYRDTKHCGGDSVVFAKSVKPSLDRLCGLYGDTAAAEFTPVRLEALQRSLIDARDKHGRPLSRRYINGKLIARVRVLFKWAVSKGLVKPEVYGALLCVEALRYGESDAPERAAVKPVDDGVIDATLPHLPPVVADMVILQRASGMRPGEVCRLSWQEIDTSDPKVWVYSPARHKTAHHGKARPICLGPKAQGVLVKYRDRPATAPIFSPAVAEAKRHAARTAARKSRVTPSEAKSRADRIAGNKRSRYGDAYTTDSYGLAVARAAKLAGVEHWALNRIRHKTATEIRRTYGLDGAGAVLGHSKLETTQIYAERDLQLAMRIAAEVG
jgi:integrase